MDLDGDEIDDVITGDYTPGNVYWFRGTETGFEKSAIVEKAIAKPADPTGEAPATASSFDMSRAMATAKFVDWDADGDLDLVVGNVRGGVFLNLNQGTKKEFQFGNRAPLTVNGSPMKVQSKSDPLPADWDGDGVLDLLVGDECAGVTFFRGKQNGSLEFESGVSLFTGKPVPTGGYHEMAKWWDEDAGIPGYRLRLAVADWNEDGLLDLLVGNCETTDAGTTGHVFLYLRN